jgi:hypothetical protein
MVARSFAIATAIAVIGSANAFVPSMSAAPTGRQQFVKSGLAAGAAAFGGALAAEAVPWQVKGKPSIINPPLPEDPNQLPLEFAQEGPAMITVRNARTRDRRPAQSSGDVVCVLQCAAHQRTVPESRLGCL